MVGLAWLVAQVLSFGAPLFDITAFSSARPGLCRADAAPALWDRARFPELSAYCLALSRGYARLATDPVLARAAAARAAGLRPTAAAPHVLAGRALYALGRSRESLESFERALAVDRTSLRSVDALHDYARSALVTGDLKRALLAYRALLPRAALASRPNLVRVEAASLLLAQGPDELREALFAIGVARQHNFEPELAPYLTGLWVLALSRAGRIDEAKAAVRQAQGVWLFFEEAEAEQGAEAARAPWQPVLLDLEKDAMIAVLAEDEAPDIAAEYYAAYLTDRSGPAPWRAYAERRLSELSGQGKRR